MVSKSTAKTVDVIIAGIILISYLFTDWEWLLADGSLNSIILVVVIGVYGIAISIALIITYLAYIGGDTSAGTSPGSRDKIKILMTAYLIIMFVGVALLLYGQLLAEDSVIYSILSAVCMIIVLILAAMTSKMKAEQQESD